MHKIIDGNNGTTTLPDGTTTTNVFVEGLHAMGVASGDEVTLNYVFCSVHASAKAKADAAGRVEWPITVPTGGGEMYFTVEDASAFAPLVEGKMEFIYPAAPLAPAPPVAPSAQLVPAVVSSSPRTPTTKSYLWLWVVGVMVAVLIGGAVVVGLILNQIPPTPKADVSEILNVSDKQASASTQTGTAQPAPAPAPTQTPPPTVKTETILVGPHSNQRTPEQKRVALCERCARWINKPPSCGVCYP